MGNLNAALEAFETRRSLVNLGMRLQEKWERQEKRYKEHLSIGHRGVLAQVCIETGLLDVEAANAANIRTLARLLASESIPIASELSELAALGLAFENGEIVAAPVIEYPPQEARD